MKRKKIENKPTVTFTTSYSGATGGDSGAGQNITVNASTTLQPSTVNDRPWTAYYVTSDDFFDILRVAFEDTYGSDHKWHPEDLYVNVSCVLEIVSNTLSNMVNLKMNRPFNGVKG